MDRHADVARLAERRPRRRRARPRGPGARRSSSPCKRRMRRPQEVRLAVGHLEAAVAQSPAVSRARSSQIGAHALGEQLASSCAAPRARRPERSPRRRGRARARRAAPRIPARRARNRRAARPAPTPLRSCERRAGAVGLEQLERGARGPAAENSMSASSSSTATCSGSPSSRLTQLGRASRAARGVVRVRDRDRARALVDGGLASSAVHATGTAPRSRGAAGHDREEGISGPRDDELADRARAARGWRR